jgi:lysophospholipase L1-like esterase
VTTWWRPRLGPLLRAALPGVRLVHAQVATYAAAWDEANAKTMGAEGPLWVVLGDSTAQGVGAPSPEEGYVGQLRQLLDAGTPVPWRVLNLSRSGARTADLIASQLPRLEALDQPADLVTCAIGANDVYHSPLPRLLEGLRTVISRLPAGAVIATIPQGLRPAKAQSANRLIWSEAPAAGLRVADVWATTGPPWEGKFAQDHFHPGRAGYAEWTRAFALTLALALGEETPPPA